MYYQWYQHGALDLLAGNKLAHRRGHGQRLDIREGKGLGLTQHLVEIRQLAEWDGQRRPANGPGSTLKTDRNLEPGFII
jgi:hypothetical protein